MSSPRRKKEIARVREEGRQAAMAGKHPDTNPYRPYDMNTFQWNQGYHLGQSEVSARESQTEMIEEEYVRPGV